MSNHMIADQGPGRVWENHTGIGLPENQRIYAVGDIHGRSDLLRILISEIRTEVEESPEVSATVVFLGDYVDRGPDSAGVIDILLSNPVPEADCIFLRGNHEQYLVDFLRDGSRYANWLMNGGAETFLSYGIDLGDFDTVADETEIMEQMRKAVPGAHQAFLRDLPHSHRIGSLFFAHAGVNPDIPIDRQRPVDLIWIRERFLRSEADLGVTVIHGHTPVGDPEVRPGRINVDTLAYASGRLTALVAEDKRFRFVST